MLTRLALAAAVLTLAALPELLPARATPDPKPLPASFPVAEAAPETFTPLCRSGQIDDSRPQPTWLRQSFIGDKCQAPPAPVAIDGYAASREAIVAGMVTAKRYVAAAEEFESCVGKFVTVRGRMLSKSEAAIQNYRITVSRQARVAARKRIDAAIMAFNEYGSTCPE